MSNPLPPTTKVLRLSPPSPNTPQVLSILEYDPATWQRYERVRRRAAMKPTAIVEDLEALPVVLCPETVATWELHVADVGRAMVEAPDVVRGYGERRLTAEDVREIERVLNQPSKAA